MTYILIVIVALYALYVGGRLKQAEANLDIIRAALERHLQTGDDYRTDTDEEARRLALLTASQRWQMGKRASRRDGDA